jgi:hypothetical protein
VLLMDDCPSHVTHDIAGLPTEAWVRVITFAPHTTHNSNRSSSWCNPLWCSQTTANILNFANFSNWERPIGFHDFVSANLLSQFILEDDGLCYSEVEFVWRWVCREIAGRRALFYRLCSIWSDTCQMVTVHSSVFRSDGVIRIPETLKSLSDYCLSWTKLLSVMCIRKSRWRKRFQLKLELWFGGVLRILEISLRWLSLSNMISDNDLDCKNLIVEFFQMLMEFQFGKVASILQKLQFLERACSWKTKLRSVIHIDRNLK